jgi:sucrose-6-phosphate hydrolase SacC (GH32 family)
MSTLLTSDRPRNGDNHDEIGYFSVTSIERNEFFQVAIIDEGHSWPVTVEYQTASRRLALRWAQQWLKDHRGCPVVIVPPEVL